MTPHTLDVLGLFVMFAGFVILSYDHKWNFSFFFSESIFIAKRKRREIERAFAKILASQNNIFIYSFLYPLVGKLNTFGL